MQMKNHTKFSRWARFCAVLFFIATAQTLAQNQSPLPEQRCEGALPLCPQPIVLSAGYPAIQPPQRLPALGVVEFPVWYTLEAAADGSFGFILAPNDPNDDYDWAMYDVTERGCEAVGQMRPIAFNLSGRRGNTGANPIGPTSEIGSGTNAPAFTSLVPMRAGRVYKLLVFFVPRQNPRGTNGGYSLDCGFTSRGVIRERSTLTIQETVPIPGTCGIGALRVTFSEPLACSSVQPRDLALQGLQIRGFSDVRSNLFGAISGTSRGFDRTYIFTLGAPVTEGGRYTLALAGTVSTACNTYNQGDTTIALEVEPSRVAVSGTPFFCAGNTTTLSVPNEFESYRWTNAVGEVVSEKSSATIGQAGTYTVEVRSGDCRASSRATVRLRENLTVQVSGATDFCEDDCGYRVVEEGFELYEWLDAANRIIARRRDLCISTPGTYRVRASINGCEALSAPFVMRKFSIPTTQPRITRRGNAFSVINPPTGNPQADSLRIEWRRLTGDGRFDFVRVGFDSLLVPTDTGRFTAAFVNSVGCWTNASPLPFTPILASAALAVGTASGAQNTLVRIPILLKGAENLAAMGVDSFRVSLRSNARLLFPEDARIRRYTVEDNVRLTQLTVPTQALRGDTLGVFTFRAMLGNTSATLLSLQDLNTVPPNLGLRMTATNGLFTLTGIATEGTVRLVGRRGTTVALRVQPNPVFDNATIVAKVDAPSDKDSSSISTFSEEVKIILTDILGQERQTVYSGVLQAGEHSLRLSVGALPMGTYLLLAQTASGRVSIPLAVVR